MKNKKEIELKPCPFCGGKAKVSKHKDNSFYVECLDCWVITRFAANENNAADNWNRRVSC